MSWGSLGFDWLKQHLLGSQRGPQGWGASGFNSPQPVYPGTSGFPNTTSSGSSGGGDQSWWQNPQFWAMILGTASSIYGARSASKDAAAAQGRANTAMDIAGNDDIEKLLMGRLSAPNSGQDSFLQYLRANPGAMDPLNAQTSNIYAGLRKQDTQDLQDQVLGLRAGAGSLGARYGTGFASREAMLRSRFGTGIAARNAGIYQQNLGIAAQDYTSTQALRQSLLPLLLQAHQGRIGAQLAASGLPYPSTGQPWAQAGGDIAQLLLLAQLFNRPPQTPGYYT